MRNSTQMIDTEMEATIIYDSYLPDALRRALEYAGEDGFVASMPQLLHARANASYDNDIWNTWSLASNSEENITRTPQGNNVVVAVHGGGIFATPERFRKLYHSNVSRHCETGYTGLFAGKITAQEAGDVVVGKLPDGTQIPVFRSTNSGRASRTCRGAMPSSCTTRRREMLIVGTSLSTT